MNTSKDNLFSIYKHPITNLYPKGKSTLNEVYKAITDDRYREVTEQLRFRAEFDRAEYSKYKNKNLDYVTFSGVFKKRTDKGLINHSRLICIDLDNLRDVTNIKEKIKTSLPPALIFISPSGKGLKVVYRIAINEYNHLVYFKSFESFFKSEFNLSIDQQCKDVSRACFLCYDPTAYLNGDAEILGAAFIDTFQPIEVSEKQQLKPQVNVERETDESVVMENLKTWLDKKVTFEEGNRNRYITQLAGAYNRYGVNESTALNDLLHYAESGFTAQEIIATVKSVYSRTQWHGIAHFDVNKPFDFENIEDFIKDLIQAEKTPLLPVEGFSLFFRNFINEYTETYKVPRDYVAASVFFSVALAVGDKLELETKYKNIPILWMALIGFSSTGKSHPLETALYPFQRADKEDYKGYKSKLREWKEYEKLSKADKKGKAETAPPEHFQYILKDYTPESLAKVHEKNKRGLCIYRDELKGWIDDFGRYNKSGEQSVMLSTFSRQTLSINRAGSEPVKIFDPAIFITGGIQPGLLEDLAKDKRAESGFLQRFLFVYPDTLQKPEYTDNTLSYDLLRDYNSRIEWLMRLEDKTTLKLSKEAKEVFMEWYEKNRSLTNGTNSEYLKSVYGKFDYYILRFAIVFRAMNMVCDFDLCIEITEREMQAAAELVEYFRTTSLKVYGIIKEAGQKRDPWKPTKKDIIKILDSYGANREEIIAATKATRQHVHKTLKSVVDK